MNLSKLKSLSGDASFRKFYRYNNIIIVVSKKESRKNLLIYDAINKILIYDYRDPIVIFTKKHTSYPFSRSIP